MSILIPLYIYPTAGSWNPLLSAAQGYPSVNFTVIINPNNGPGTTTLPDANYMEALRSITRYPNVDILGYVASTYGARDIADIEADIATYSGWGDEISLQGIFIDEAPSGIEYGDFMSDITLNIRETWAETLDMDATVVYNPGVVIDQTLYSNADLIVAFEGAEADRWAFMEHGLANLDSENGKKTAVIVHTFNGTSEDLEKLVREVIESNVGSLFVTDRLYSEWPGVWRCLVETVAGKRCQREPTV
ncbi:uncharacterized protein DNG_07068 [Cephalotrichum gorgonifer]|uniref:Spherulation-specific family 4 n=1 Tax=Cephalotrichum gorgonifer TaxID=2041049 RepID=A0AAE8N2R6_9PEZI|nr:uncharacterized protein DNG_07068 [Cephalotrichum gorgonifer]